MELFLDPEARMPLTGQLYEQLRRGIAGGRLLPGDQLTPSRQLAAELGVSRHTVTTAYGRLMAEGYTLGHAGGGSVVAPTAPVPSQAAGLVTALRPARRCLVFPAGWPYSGRSVATAAATRRRHRTAGNSVESGWPGRRSNR